MIKSWRSLNFKPLNFNYIHWLQLQIYNNLSMYIYIKINVCLSIYLSVFYTFLNGWTDFEEIFWDFLSDVRDDLDSQLDSAGLTQGDAQTGILRLTMEIFIYKWLLLDLILIIIIISAVVGTSMYLSIECLEFEPRFRWTNILDCYFYFFIYLYIRMFG